MLDEYRRKRDPRRTPEPFGAPRSPDGRLFVVQQHGARRLHYDLRLEIGGALVSWAVPRGPSLDPADKRLAVHTEDHPLEYADFEGVIPEGNYGAGPMIVWDRGWYRPLQEGDPAERVTRGRLDFELYGHKLRGAYTLVKTAGAGERDWLLLKKRDAYAGGPEPTERLPESVLSGLTLQERRDGHGKVAALRARLDGLGAPRRRLGPVQPVMLATLVDEAFSDRQWVFEIKYDGVRVLAWRAGTEVKLHGRSGQDVTSRYPEVAVALRTLPLDDFLLDGEIVALDEQGRPSFQRLQARMGLTRAADVERMRALVPVSAVFFDALALDGRDVRAAALRERKACLAMVLPPRGVVAYGAHVEADGQAFLDAACARDLEGIVAKKATSPYTGTRSRDWLKIKCQKRQEFVIGGWTEPQGTRPYFGALHLGLYEDDRLVYVSKVGTGFDDRTLRQVWDRMQALRRSTSPFQRGSPGGRGHHWIEPRLVGEVRFTEWTAEGGLRHPAFLGLRDDKDPRECRREVPAAVPPVAEAPPAGPDGDGARPPRRTRARRARSAPASAAPASAAPASAGRRVTISNPDKRFWPDDGYTKGDLVAYYERMAPRLLPYLQDRPVVLTRYPDGITGKSFYQKDAPAFAPDWVRRHRIWAEEVRRDIDYIVVDDVETLRWVVNLGTIPLHLWASRVASLDRPDWLVLDLDPKGAPFTDVVEVARTLHRILDDLQLPSYVKTSGATGLHILLPLGARYSYEETRTFARLLATLGHEAQPGISTLARPLRARGGKVYIDWGQNAPGQTIVAPYSVRPLPGAPVSCPLRWDEVTPRLDPRRFTIATIPRRFAAMDDPLSLALRGSIDLRAALHRLAAPRAPPAPGA
jgi:bifunctional non-homologous end joining protein LigD